MWVSRCVSRARPRVPSSFTGAACHRINIALHNPGSVSARLDPLPQPRSAGSPCLGFRAHRRIHRIAVTVLVLAASDRFRSSSAPRSAPESRCSCTDTTNRSGRPIAHGRTRVRDQKCESVVVARRATVPQGVSIATVSVLFGFEVHRFRLQRRSRVRVTGRCPSSKVHVSYGLQISGWKRLGVKRVGLQFARAHQTRGNRAKEPPRSEPGVRGPRRFSDTPNVQNAYLEIDRENSEDEADLRRYAGAVECATDGFS